METLNRVATNGSAEGDKGDGAPLTAVISDPSVVSSSKQTTPKANNRSPSGHSLLATNVGADLRRGASFETTRGTTEKASISMPPPLGKPSNDRRLSASLMSVKQPRRSEDAYATSPPASVKSFDERQQFATSPQMSTTATDTTAVTTASAVQQPGPPVLSSPVPISTLPNDSNLVSNYLSQSPPVSETAKSETAISSASRETPKETTKEKTATGPALLNAPRPEGNSEGALPSRGPRAATPRSISASRRLSRTNSKEAVLSMGKPLIGKIGVCALDVKARSRPSRQILTRLQSDEEFEVIVFGDKVILDENVENWPICDFLISFFSDGFPLDKAIAYSKLRKPFMVNDLQMQKILWDRRLCLMILDKLRVPTPTRLMVTHDGGPRLESAELAQHVKKVSGISLTGPEDGTGGGETSTKTVELSEDGDTLIIDGKPIRKPFVEKPVSGEDHNVIIYFPKSHEGGGARRLFRKIGNKSSEFDPELTVPRCITEPGSTYIYEQFLKSENAEDVKAYTVGSHYCHAETRKSPVVDGLVRRNTHGKELRYVTKLNDAEKQMAGRIAKGFGQRICGFDLLRAGSSSYVIDVNGWSFVKDNEAYYNDCARILKSIFSDYKFQKSDAASDASSVDASSDQTQRKQHNAHHHHTHQHAGPSHQKANAPHGSHFHRNALKTILKSPSMNRLSAHIPGSRHHESGVTSSKVSSQTTPLSSPPTMERIDPSQSLPSIPPMVASVETLPPPVLPVENRDGAALLEEDVPEPERTEPAPMPSSKHSWKLKGVVTVIRHADRTPKQKIKFTAHSQVFVDLLKGHHDEVLLKGETALTSVQVAVKMAMDQKLEDPEKLRNLQNALNRKIGQPDTKVQIKPIFRKRKPNEGRPTSSSQQQPMTPGTIPEDGAPPPELMESPSANESSLTPGVDPLARMQTRSDSISGNTFSRFAAQENDLVIDKMQLVMKWGGEPTHSARYQSQDLGSSMRDDYNLLSRAVLNDVRIFSSSEKRVKTSAQIWAAAFLDQKDLPDDFIHVRKDLLDDSNAAKDVMDKVKKKLKHLLREGNSVPEQFAWPKDMPEPYVVMQIVIDLLKFHRKVMRHNFKKLLQGGQAAASLAALNNTNESKDNVNELIDVSSIQARWCTGEDAELFKERWEKLFKEFCDTEKADPSKVSELYDTMKYDALHNKQFLEWVFTPSQSVIDEINKEEGILSQNASPEPNRTGGQNQPISHRDSEISFAGSANDGRSFTQKIGLRRKSVLAQPPSTPPLMSYEQDASYFKLFSGSGDSKSKVDKRLGRLRELYRYAKVLFDYVGPQEYGISDDEKLEIGLLTSLPLLREIVQDLEELQASNESASFIYFTKESHIYTLLNCIMEGGIHTKIKRATIPELDYLSQICFELYEAKDSDTDETAYSIRISISPGCHTIDPLDVSLDSKHAIGTAPRRSLTNHQDWKEVISTLKAKFDTVQLPKSFLAVNVSEKHEQDSRRASIVEEETARLNRLTALEQS